MLITINVKHFQFIDFWYVCFVWILQFVNAQGALTTETRDFCFGIEF